MKTIKLPVKTPIFQYDREARVVFDGKPPEDIYKEITEGNGNNWKLTIRK